MNLLYCLIMGFLQEVPGDLVIWANSRNSVEDDGIVQNTACIVEMNVTSGILNYHDLCYVLTELF